MNRDWADKEIVDVIATGKYIEIISTHYGAGSVELDEQDILALLEMVRSPTKHSTESEA